MSRQAVIIGSGHGVPSKIVTNQDLEAIVDTSDAWIVQRTGIKERRIVQQGEHTGTLSVAAAKRFYLLDLYGKAEKDDLTPVEKQQLRLLAEQLKKEATAAHERWLQENE